MYVAAAFHIDRIILGVRLIQYVGERFYFLMLLYIESAGYGVRIYGCTESHVCERGLDAVHVLLHIRF